MKRCGHEWSNGWGCEHRCQLAPDHTDRSIGQRHLCCCGMIDYNTVYTDPVAPAPAEKAH